MGEPRHETEIFYYIWMEEARPRFGEEDIERFKGARWNFFFFISCLKKTFCPFIN